MYFYSQESFPYIANVDLRSIYGELATIYFLLLAIYFTTYS